VEDTTKPSTPAFKEHGQTVCTTSRKPEISLPPTYTSQYMQHDRTRRLQLVLLDHQQSTRISTPPPPLTPPPLPSSSSHRFLILNTFPLTPRLPHHTMATIQHHYRPTAKALHKRYAERWRPCPTHPPLPGFSLVLVPTWYLLLLSYTSTALHSLLFLFGI
jgi:hypothetical protein